MLKSKTSQGWSLESRLGDPPQAFSEWVIRGKLREFVRVFIGEIGWGGAKTYSPRCSLLVGTKYLSFMLRPWPPLTGVPRGRKVPHGVFFECFQSPDLEVPPKSASKMHSKALRGGLRARCPKHSKSTPWGTFRPGSHNLRVLSLVGCLCKTQKVTSCKTCFQRTLKGGDEGRVGAKPYEETPHGKQFSTPPHLGVLLRLCRGSMPGAPPFPCTRPQECPILSTTLEGKKGT